MAIWGMSVKKPKWNFPSGKNLEMTSGSNAAIETFHDNPIYSLAREICQNSLDAKRDDVKGPVRVNFKVMEIDATDIPGYEELESTIIPKADKQWKDEKKTQVLLNKMKKTLSGKKVKVLKISDYNTTGLEKRNWKSLIEESGSSQKVNDSSAGSFGIGKGAPFVLSNLRMVLYATKTTSEEKSIGVMKFVSYPVGRGEVTQGTGYFTDGDAKEPMTHSILFDKAQRNELGTDIYVVGFDEHLAKNWERDITFALADSFLMSFYTNKLEVLVEDRIINFQEISKIINEIKNTRGTRKYNDVARYYDVLLDVDHKEFPFTGFEEFGIGEDEAKLYVTDKGNTNRRVLLTRQAGMRIKDQKNISGGLKFSGIFHASGPNINARLKEMENPTHNDWSKDRAVKPGEAKRFLDKLRKYIKNTILDEYRQNIGDEVSAFGVSDFLPSDLNLIRLKEKAKKKEEGKPKAKKKKAKSTLQKRQNKSKITDVNRKIESIADESNDTLGLVGYNDDGTAGGNGYDGQGAGGGGTEGQNNGVGNEDGNKKTDSNSDKKINSKNKKSEKITSMNYRCIERDYKQGKYRLVIKPNKTIYNVKIHIYSIGDSGSKGNVILKDASLTGANLEVKYSNINIDELKGNTWHRLDIDLDSQSRMKLEVEVNGNY